MIAIDSSALLAIFQNEPERDAFQRAIAAASACALSTVTLLETRIVIFGRYGEGGTSEFEEWLNIVVPEIVAFDRMQSDAAFRAFKQYGKGINAQAGLNFGDCASYALAKTRGIPLLFKGRDFAATDIAAAM